MIFPASCKRAPGNKQMRDQKYHQNPRWVGHEFQTPTIHTAVTQSKTAPNRPAQWVFQEMRNVQMVQPLAATPDMAGWGPYSIEARPGLEFWPTGPQEGPNKQVGYFLGCPFRPGHIASVPQSRHPVVLLVTFIWPHAQSEHLCLFMCKALFKTLYRRRMRGVFKLQPALDPLL